MCGFYQKKIRTPLILGIMVVWLSLSSFAATLDPVQQADLGSVTIGYQIIGQGEPFLLLMGLGGTIDDWPRYLVDALALRFQLILMDNRGMGHSTDTDQPFSYSLLAEDAIRLLDFLEIESAHMLGYSMGSMFIQHLLIHHPQRVRKAILYGTSIDTAGLLALLREFANAPLPESGPVKKQLDIVDDWKTPLDKIQGIDHDVLLIVGQDDLITPPSHSLLLSGLMPNAWLARPRGYDHYMVFANPEGFTSVVLSFFDLDIP